MTVLNYFREQKRKLEERHFGETILCLAGEEPIGITEIKATGAQADGVRTAQEILSEIDDLRGLNVRERERASAEYRGRKAGKLFA